MFTSKPAHMATKKELELNTHQIREAHKTVRAIDHMLRRRMLDTIYDAGRITVTDLYIKMRMEQSVCSQHLHIMARAGLVIGIRSGKFIEYSVNMERIDVVKKAIENLSDRNN